MSSFFSEVTRVIYGRDAVNDLVLVQTYIIEIIEQKTLPSHVVMSYFDHRQFTIIVVRELNIRLF